MNRRLRRRELRRLPVNYSEPELGRRMHSRAIVLRGNLGLRGWQRFATAAAKALGMTPVYEQACWIYPLEGGKGGKGYTIVQPLTESFIALDVWTDHDGAYLFIASCKEFFPARLRELIAVSGLEEDDMSEPITLRLDPEAL